jgi:hypothetical protein
MATRKATVLEQQPPTAAGCQREATAVECKGVPTAAVQGPTVVHLLVQGGTVGEGPVGEGPTALQEATVAALGQAHMEEVVVGAAEAGAAAGFETPIHQGAGSALGAPT